MPHARETVTPAAIQVWELPDPREPHSKLLSWRLFRQFQSPAQLADEFGRQPQFAWKLSDRRQDAGATKLLLESSDGRRCEAVALFPSGGRQLSTAGSAASPKRLPRATACISSQPGCGVGCPFCATGELGYRGNLSAVEIAEQVYWAGLFAREAGRRLRNVVYMGMGEPLHNTANVFASLELLISERYFGIPPRRITVSTAGVPTAMVALARQFPEVRLALSLHAAQSDLRRQLVPRAVSDLQLLRETINQVNALQPTHPVWLEIVLFEHLNDGPEQAQALIDFCRNLRVEVNLIGYNTAAGAELFTAASPASREAFAKTLREAGIRTTLRTSLGSSNQAACGQLNALT